MPGSKLRKWHSAQTAGQAAGDSHSSKMDNAPAREPRARFCIGTLHTTSVRCLQHPPQGTLRYPRSPRALPHNLDSQQCSEMLQFTYRWASLSWLSFIALFSCDPDVSWLSLYSRWSILSWQSVRARGAHFSRLATWPLKEIHTTQSETFTDKSKVTPAERPPGPEPLSLLILSLTVMPFEESWAGQSRFAMPSQLLLTS